MEQRKVRKVDRANTWTWKRWTESMKEEVWYGDHIEIYS